MTMTIEEKYDFFTKRVLSMPSILKDLIFGLVIEHRNLFMYFLQEYLDIYDEVKNEWGQYDPESVTFEMDPQMNADLKFRMEDHKFHIHYSMGEHYDSELLLKIDDHIRLSVVEQPDNRPMVTISRY